MAFSLQRALVTDPAISSEADRVTIEVRNGIVALRGRPSDPQNREAIERVANRTPGVVVVQDLFVTSAR